jgi:hypothetical protein
MGSLKFGSWVVRDSIMRQGKLLLLRSRTQRHFVCILAMISPIASGLREIQSSITSNSIGQSLSETILYQNKYFNISLLIQNKSVQSNRGYELFVGEARRLSYSASYLLSPNSANHYSIAPECLKFSKSMSSRRLRHLTCL